MALNKKEKGKIRHWKGDAYALRCICGNTPDAHGFHPCNRHGTMIEPDERTWKGLFVCDRCGRIFSLEMIEEIEEDERQPDHTPLLMEK